MLTKAAAFSLIFCVLFANGVSPAKPTNTIHISISVESSSHQAAIKSYLSREIRQLDDVKIVYDKKGYELAVVHIHQGGFHFLSIVVSHCLAPGFLIESARSNFSQNTCSIHSHVLRIYESDIAEMCKAIIAKIDVDIFEPVREMRHLLNDIQQKLID